MYQRIKELSKYFGIYGKGNFNLTIKDIEELVEALFSKKYIHKLKKLYERLEKERMG